ncbi:hypothetical protein SAMN05444722_2457 [Rhodovulum sp. ES.010]|uniref:peroxide stress protein YaaA n=1 Tax=Rhodovulum sp. ES.010 TaxID=1882821 RepID=UPI000925B489|nr:peroxide stress protein YaaA [Rhodovulum sp. ES.010]SIO47797.1 hypothetical protein SAMN05444722_2457 [Rhodovulum sp. ES.010]
MLVVISPAKRLDLAPVEDVPCTAPAFQGDAVHLAEVARGLSPAELSRLMGISDKLAKLNAERFRDFAADPAPEAVKPAALAFAGDTYAGLEAASLDPDDLRVAQDRLRILSGLYGLLRPLDAIQPYRLEMGSRLETENGKSLYDYWGDRLAHALNEAAREAGTDILVNCASQEYFGAVDRAALRLRVITPVFFEERPSGPKIVSFFAKKARGAMARFIVERRLTDPEGLADFDTGGYRYVPEMSEPDRPVYLRGDDGA